MTEFTKAVNLKGFHASVNPKFYRKNQYILMWCIESYTGEILDWNP